jgi:hypothetical protein
MKCKKHDHGVIERTEILTKDSQVEQFTYFLLVIDTATKKVLSRYGSFDTPELAIEYANAHGVTLG